MAGEATIAATALAPNRTAEAALTIVRLFRAMERVEAALTPQQYRMLKLIGAGGERSAHLAEKLTVAKPTLTSTADGLVAAGLLSREPETSDRRVVRLWLTEAGQAAVDRADRDYASWLSEIVQAAGDPDQLLTSFEQLDHALDEVRSARQAARAAGQAGEHRFGRPSPERSVSKRKALAAAVQSARRPPE